MADIQKPTEVPETTPTVTEGVTEAKPIETTTAAETTPAVAETTEAPAVEAATETPAAAETTAAETKKEVTPVEEGHLEHKAAPASFPKNLIYSKQHFWFGSEPVSSEKLSTYLKNEKATDVAHHVASWASHTGKGLLFYGKDSDKTTPHGAIQLAETTEPKTEGLNKFFVVSKGHKHTFKAANATERDNWVSQIKLKITEAKELATTITENETYKSTLESLKPKPVVAAKKEEKPVVAAAPVTEAPAATTTAEEPVVEASKEEAKEEKKVEEPKRRSASRKRGSIFGSLLGKKEETKKEEVKKDETPAVAATEAPAAETTPAVEPVAATEAPATETAATTEAPVVDAPAAEEKPVEAVKETKPTPSKRNSIFGGLSFSSKKKTETDTAAPVTPAKETTAADEPAPVAETAPVIPAVETTAPLSAEVASPATVPTETVDATPATNGESKKEVKSDKRKSSLPFAFGKKEKSATSDEEGEKTKSPPFFSKLRQTVKGKTSSKPTEKPAAEKAVEEKPAETAAVEAPAAETSTTTAAETTPAVPEVEETKPVAPPATASVTAAA